MQEVYWGVYKLGKEGLMELQGEEQVVPPENIPVPDGDDWTGAGSGWETYHEVMSNRLNGKVKNWEGNVFLHAQDILPLAKKKFQQGEVVAAELAIPVYLRDQVAWKKHFSSL
jgi:tRNA threonylcarbamoyladenosine biosynthesis protein TsaB